MNRKGFTLIELLAVIVIIGLIALVSVSAVTGALKAYKNDLYESQLTNIESAARLWVSDNLDKVPEGDNENDVCDFATYNNCPDTYNKLIIYLTDLQNGGYISSDLKNVKTKQPFKKVQIIIQKNVKKIDYQVVVEE